MASVRFAELTPYHTHQVIELPVIRPEVTHWLLHQGQCLSCGTLCKASLPAEQGSGYGPRLTGFVGEMAGIVGASRSAVQDLCASVFGIPLSKGAIQKMVDRVSAAIMPHYTAIGEVARASLVNYIDETSWLMHGDRHWLWVMANPEVAYFQIHPTRSKAAFAQLIADWRGILVSDGYLVYQRWQGLRQSCLAHLLRTAKGLAESVEAGIARFGRTSARRVATAVSYGHGAANGGAVAGVVCALPLTHHPTHGTGGQGRDVCPAVAAGRGVAVGISGRPRAWKPRITWRSAPIASGCCGANGARERVARRAIAGWNGSCHLRHTCRIRGRPTFPVLVEAVSCLFKGERPDLSWITQHEPLPVPSTP